MTALLLHPIGLDRRTWDRVPIDDALAIDLPGHGDVALGSIDSLEAVADAVAHRLPRGEAVDVVGISLGGMTALHLVLRHPDRVRSLVVACAPAATPTEVMRQRADDTERLGMEGMIEGMMERWFTPVALADRAAFVVETERCLLADEPAEVAAVWRLIADHDVVGSLQDIRVPVTVIAGSFDLSVPPSAARSLAQGIPDARYVELEGPHMLHLEQAGLFGAAVREHLDHSLSAQ